MYSSWEVLGYGGRADIGNRAVVYDDTGTFEAISVSDALMAAGAEVTFLSRHEQLGATILYPAATVEASRERLFAGAFSFTPAVALRAITPRGGYHPRPGHLHRTTLPRPTLWSS